MNFKFQSKISYHSTGDTKIINLNCYIIKFEVRGLISLFSLLSFDSLLESILWMLTRGNKNVQDNSFLHRRGCKVATPMHRSCHKLFPTCNKAHLRSSIFCPQLIASWLTISDSNKQAINSCIPGP